MMPPLGNVQAPPVYSDVPPAPFTTPSTVVAPPVVTVPGPATSPSVPPSPVPVVVQSIAVPPPGAVPIGQDYLRVSPDRVLAPVGSEVVLKAGICSAGGYLLTDRRVEWLLARDGTGQFVDVAERDQIDLFRAPWDTPQKVDNWYVVSATSGAPTVLTRGNADPSDDIHVLDGEAWVSVTSAREGTSRITAFTPTIGNWQFRQASATIHWVDAQWVFPPSAIVEAGRPHVLTTALMRRTDGSPLSGWIVRYEVGSGGTLGYEGGRFVEVPVDAAGRASVEVSPANAGGGSTVVDVAIIRPQTTGPDVAPRMELGRGRVVITWGAGTAAPAPIAPGNTGTPSAPGIPGLPPPPVPTGGVAPSLAEPGSAPEPAPRPTLPSSTPPSDRYAPPPSEQPPGKTLLEVSLRRIGPDAIAVGDYVSFEVTVTNRGDGLARNIEVRDRFDAGLSHPSAKPNEYSIEYLGMRDLGPGESAALPSPLTFQVIAAGQQCHEVTVTADGAAQARRSACITTRPAAVEVAVTGERLRFVGETAAFNIVVRNVGETAATDLEVVSKTDPALNPTKTEASHDRLADGSVVFRIERLEPGGRQAFRMLAECVAPGNNVCNRVTVTSGGRVMASQDACLEIQPPMQNAAPAPGASPPTSVGLQTTFASTKNPARVGEAAEIYVTVTNRGQQAAQQVTLTVLLPQEMTPDDARIRPAGQFSRVGQEIRFRPVDQLMPNQQMQVIVPVTPNQPGQVRVRAEITAAGLQTPLRIESQVMDVLSAPL
jgi:uncharacterized repeat protein (TIGR01451 family)